MVSPRNGAVAPFTPTCLAGIGIGVPQYAGSPVAVQVVVNGVEVSGRGWRVDAAHNDGTCAGAGERGGVDGRATIGDVACAYVEADSWDSAAQPELPTGEGTARGDEGLADCRPAGSVVYRVG